MQLTEEERKAIVVYRLEKAESALVEAKDCVSLNHWNLAANRLYYAAYYASSALLISAGHAAKTHDGTIGMIGQHYVRTGVLTNEDTVPFWPGFRICVTQEIMMTSLTGHKKTLNLMFLRLKPISRKLRLSYTSNCT